MNTMPIPGFAGYYADEDGNIFSGYLWGGKLTNTIQRRMTPQLDPESGRLQLRLKGPSGTRSMKVATLILLTFRGPPPPGHEASHLNGDSCDNRLANLAWETHTENERRKVAHGTLPLGDTHASSKLSDAQVDEIRILLAEGHLPQKEIASRFGVSQSHIAGINNGTKRARHAAAP